MNTNLKTKVSVQKKVFLMCQSYNTGLEGQENEEETAKLRQEDGVEVTR
jgi:hypothetical protein